MTGEPVELEREMARLRAVLGRPPRVLHIGNIANNAYNNARIQRRHGIEADVLCYHYYHIMGCPEWEDGTFEGEVDADLPNWFATSLGGWSRPDWFVQGPTIQSVQYLKARRLRLKMLSALIWTDLQARYWRDLETAAARRGAAMPAMPLKLRAASKFMEYLRLDPRVPPRIRKPVIADAVKALRRSTRSALQWFYDTLLFRPVQRALNAGDTNAVLVRIWSLTRRLRGRSGAVSGYTGAPPAAGCQPGARAMRRISRAAAAIARRLYIWSVLGPARRALDAGNTTGARVGVWSLGRTFRGLPGEPRVLLAFMRSDAAEAARILVAPQAEPEASAAPAIGGPATGEGGETSWRARIRRRVPAWLWSSARFAIKAAVPATMAWVTRAAAGFLVFCRFLLHTVLPLVVSRLIYGIPAMRYFRAIQAESRLLDSPERHARANARREDMLATAREAGPEVETSTRNYADYHAPQFVDILRDYDIVQGYSIDGFIPYIGGFSRFASYEHGTIRELPWEASLVGVVCRRVYQESPAVFVTNSDVLPSVARLGIAPSRAVYLPHAFDDAKLRAFRTAHPELMAPEHEAVFFSPTRQHWRDENRSWCKGNDVFLRAAGTLAKAGRRFRIVLVEWGQEVGASRELIDELGITDMVEWVPRMQKRELWERYCTSHAVVDQFALPALGGTGFETLALGRRLITALDRTQCETFFGAAPPCMVALTPDECARHMEAVLDDPLDTAGVGAASAAWIARYHSAERIVALQAAAYNRILESVPAAPWERP